jgi:hypothetical protein
MERATPWVPVVLLFTTVATLGLLFVVLRPEMEFALTDPSSYRACVLWMASFVAFAMFATWLSLISLFPIITYMSPVQQRVGVGVGVLMAIGVGVWRLLPFSKGPSLLSPLLPIVVNVINPIGNAAGCISVWLMTYACVALALESGPPDAAEFRRKLDIARLILFSSAALLAVNVAQIYLLYDWPMRLRRVATSSHEAQSTAVTYAVVYTTMLLAAHLPLNAILELRSREVGAPVSLEAAHDGPAALPAIGRSPLARLAEVLAVACPMATALGLKLWAA